MGRWRKRSTGTSQEVAMASSAGMGWGLAGFVCREGSSNDLSRLEILVFPTHAQKRAHEWATQRALA